MKSLLMNELALAAIPAARIQKRYEVRYQAAGGRGIPGWYWRFAATGESRAGSEHGPYVTEEAARRDARLAAIGKTEWHS